MRKNTATTTILLLIVSIIFASCTKKENEKIIQKNEIEVADRQMANILPTMWHTIVLRKTRVTTSSM